MQEGPVAFELDVTGKKYAGNRDVIRRSDVDLSDG